MSGRISPKVWDKARTLDEEAVLPDPEYPTVFRVRGSDGTMHRVQLYDTHATCGCVHGSNTPDARCYHVAAAILRREASGGGR